MEQFIDWMLGIHIASGMTAFFLAPVAMAVKKGGKAHRLWGKIYFYAMAVVAVTAIIISAYRPIPFLLMLAVFSFYLAFSGYRSLYRKQLPHGGKLATIDWVGTIINALFSLCLLAYGIYLLIEDTSNGLGILSSIFGAIGLNGAVADFRYFSNPGMDKHKWLINHIVGMLASYIAAVSAFSAVNFDFLPMLIRWLWPTVLGTIAIFYYVKKYRTKFSAGNKAKQIAEIKIQEELAD